MRKTDKLSLTLKGLVFVSLDFNETLTNKVINDLELHIRRFYMEDGGYGAIVFDGKNFIFTTVEKLAPERE